MASSNIREELDTDEKVFHLVTGKYAFREGEEFNSYEALMQRMMLHTQESMVYYWHRDSRTVKNAFTKTTRPISAHLKYYSIRFACIYSDMKKELRKVRMRAERFNHRRTDCQAYVLFRATKCGNALQVSSLCNVHNHEISERMTEKLPQTRRMSADVKEEVIEMLKLKIDRKKILDYVQIRENKLLKMKSLFNLSARLRTSELASVDGESRVAVLQRLIRFAKDKGILSSISNELANYDIDEATYDEVDSDHLIQYISPDHEFGVNETIIESIVESRHRETPLVMAEGHNSERIEFDESDMMHVNEVRTDITKKSSTLCSHDTLLDVNKTNNDTFIEKSLIYYANHNEDEPQQNSLESVTSGSVVTLDESVSHLIEFDQDDEEVISSESIPLNNCSVVLYETTTDVVSSIENKDESRQFNSENIKSVNVTGKECGKVKRIINKTAKRISKCSRCRTDFRVVRAQVEYLIAKRRKLLEETKILKLKKKKLLEDINKFQ